MAGLGDIFGSSDSSAQDYLKQALQAYQSVNVPTIASETVSNLPQEQVAGTVTPNSIQVANQAPTEFNNISLDPSTRAAQIAALTQYQNITDNGGLDANAKMALQQVIDAAKVQSQGAQGAIQQEAQARGQGGGDFDLTQRAIAAQGASNNAATQGMAAAAEAEANREAALNQMANIGGSVNAADYGQAANKAASQNTINATNTAATNAANTGNVTNAINTGEFNVGNAQGVNTRNTAAKQGNVYYNAGLPQQQFNNELQKAGGIAGVNTSQAGAAQQAAANNAAMTGQLIGTAGTIGATAMGGPVAGAAANGLLHSGATSASAPVPGGSTPTGVNAQKSQYGLAHGGEVCYADGGVAHDHAICMKLGGHVPGKAKVAGDSEMNDTVDAKLSPGEIVIPRSIANDPNAAREFVKKENNKGKIDLAGFTKNYKRGK